MRVILRSIPQWALSLLWLSLFCTFGLYNSPALAQDTTWQQVLGGWVDDVYYENLFLGGAYYTRISLADIDGDNDLDMFYGGGDCGSLVYFDNVGNIQEPTFELRYEEFPGLVNAPYVYGGTVDVDFADLDADGDLDAAYSSNIDLGGAISWNDGTPQEPEFGFRQPNGPGQGQSNVTLVDIDNDGDYDYFSGQGYRDRQMYFAENVGSSEVPHFEHRTYHYQNLELGVPFNFDFGDIDEDGDYDLLVCKHGGNIAYYENTGSPEEANFVLITSDFLPDRDTTDWMETPELADIDDDGDLDLFLAGGYAHLYYFENLGASEDPQFVQRSDTSYFYVIPHIGGMWLGNSVDIDADGDDDHPQYALDSDLANHAGNPSAHHAPVTSVDGLSGGTITSQVTVQGNMRNRTSGGALFAEIFSESNTGVVQSYGPNGQRNARLTWLTGQNNRGYVAVSDESGMDRAGLYVNDTGGGQLHTRGPNNNLNTYLGYLNNHPNKGYVGVLNDGGAWKAGMCVAEDGRGIVWGDEKNFRVSNPNQPGTEIWYCSLEDPEAAAYIRGTGHLSNGGAEISLPEHFTAVASSQRITVQLTPLSAESKGLAAVEKTAHRIIVRELQNGNGNYDFDYSVMAVRKGYEDYQVIRPALEARPGEIKAAGQ